MPSARHKAPPKNKHRSGTQGSVSKSVLLPTFAAVTAAGLGVAGVVGGAQFLGNQGSGSTGLALSDAGRTSGAKAGADQGSDSGGSGESGGSGGKAGKSSKADADEELPPAVVTAPKPKPENYIASGQQSIDRGAILKVREERQERADRAAREKAEQSGDPKDYARAMLSDYDWSEDQFSCLESMWNRESRWDHTATNPSSGAYGIAQALPGSKMSSAGSDWRTNYKTQIKWGLGYIQDRYDSPCGAWSFWQRNNWY